MWDVFKDWIFDIIHFFYDFCGDWGLAHAGAAAQVR